MADAWALDFGTAGSKAVDFSTISLGSNYKVKVKCSFKALGSQRVVTMGASAWVGLFNNNFIAFYEGVFITGSSPVIDQIYNIEINCTSNTVNFLVDGSLIGSQNQNATPNIISISRTSANQFRGVFYNAEIETNGIKIHSYNPTATGGTGSILQDTSGGNNGTLLNFPTDDSQWLLYDDGTGTADTTITLESSSYAITGQPIDLRANRKIDLAPSSYSQTGSNINLLHNKRIGLDSGTYTLNGTSIELTYNQASSYLITLESSEYSAIGTDVDLLHNKRLETETGTYSLIGADVNLLHNKRINLEPGNYAIVGTAIDFNYATTASYRISLNSGTYEITGEELALRHNKLIGLDAGQYQSTGTALDLLYNRAISLGSGNYSIIGTDIDMLFNRSISLESGEYQIDGTSINLTYSGFVELRIDGYSVMFKQSLAQANYTRNLINTQYKHN